MSRDAIAALSAYSEPRTAEPWETLKTRAETLADDSPENNATANADLLQLIARENWGAAVEYARVWINARPFAIRYRPRAWQGSVSPVLIPSEPCTLEARPRWKYHGGPRAPLSYESAFAVAVWQALSEPEIMHSEPVAFRSALVRYLYGTVGDGAIQENARTAYAGEHGDGRIRVPLRAMLADESGPSADTEARWQEYLASLDAPSYVLEAAGKVGPDLYAGLRREYPGEEHEDKRCHVRRGIREAHRKQYRNHCVVYVARQLAVISDEMAKALAEALGKPRFDASRWITDPHQPGQWDACAQALSLGDDVIGRPANPKCRLVWPDPLRRFPLPEERQPKRSTTPRRYYAYPPPEPALFFVVGEPIRRDVPPRRIPRRPGRAAREAFCERTACTPRELQEWLYEDYKEPAVALEPRAATWERHWRRMQNPAAIAASP